MQLKLRSALFAIVAMTLCVSRSRSKLLVLDIVDRGAGADLTRVLSESIAVQAGRSSSGDVVSAAALRATLDAAELALLSGCEEEACMADLAGEVEADRVLGGSAAIELGRDDEISTIVMLGDSITDGVGSSRDSNNRWPNHFARRLLKAEDMPAFAVANAGLSGNRVLHENSARFGENLQVRLERDVLALSNVSHVVLLEGINDIGMATMFAGEEVSADDIIAGYRQVIARLHDKDIKVIGATLTPYEGAGYYREEGERKRQQVNAWIRNSGEFDGVIDFEDSVKDLTNPLQLIAEFTADNLHPNDDGYAAMANVVSLDLFR